MEPSNLSAEPPAKPSELAEHYPPVAVAQGYVPAETEGPGYETTDLSIPAIGTFFATGVGLIVVLLVVVGGLFGIYRNIATRGDIALPPLATDEPAVPPEPRLQQSPQVDMIRFRELQAEQLSSYEWVDEAGGRARIPIDVAIELIASEGLDIVRTEQPPSSGDGSGSEDETTDESETPVEGDTSGDSGATGEGDTGGGDESSDEGDSSGDGDGETTGDGDETPD